jgi:hypothetical protein
LIIARVGSLAYLLQLPESMARVQIVFHVSILRKYIRDPEVKIEVDPIFIQQDLTIDSHPTCVLEFSEHVMHNSTIKYVKILWSNQTEQECTWELESTMHNKYPDLYETEKLLWYMFHLFFFGSISSRI